MPSFVLYFVPSKLQADNWMARVAAAGKALQINNLTNLSSDFLLRCRPARIGFTAPKTNLAPCQNQSSSLSISRRCSEMM